MKPAPFEYHRPTTIDAAVDRLAELPDAKVMAGNQSLSIIMSNRLATPEHVVDINEIDDLQYVDVTAEAVEIGALTRHADVEHSEQLADTVPLLPEAVSYIAGPVVRNRGTIGGSIAEADPAGNYGAALLALDGELEVRSVDGARTIPIEEFFVAYMFTELEEDELITAVRVPREPFPPDRTGMRYELEKQAAQTWPTLGTGAVVRVDDPDADDPVVEDVRLAFANAADVPLRAPEAEATIEGEPLSEAALETAAEIVYETVDPEEELHADETYKRELAAAHARRAVSTAHDRAVGENGSIDDETIGEEDHT